MTKNTVDDDDGSERDDKWNDNSRYNGFAFLRLNICSRWDRQSCINFTATPIRNEHKV